MDAVILCGGMGTRLKAVTGDKPKVLADVSGKPFLEYLINDFKTQGIKRVILCTGFGAKAVEEYCKVNIKGIEVIFSYEDKPLGTGGAIKNASQYITSETFLALNGDVFFRIDVAVLEAFHRQHRAVATLVTSMVDDARDFGTIIVDDKYRIRQFLEKDPNVKRGEVSVGFYCFNKSIFAKMPVAESFSIEREVFPQLVNDPFYAFKISESFLDIGTPERYKEAQERFKK